MKVHDQLSFICDICGKTFLMKAYLQQHMQGAHLGGGVEGWHVARSKNGQNNDTNMKIPARNVQL